MSTVVDISALRVKIISILEKLKYIFLMGMEASEDNLNFEMFSGMALWGSSLKKFN